MIRISFRPLAVALTVAAGAAALTASAAGPAPGPTSRLAKSIEGVHKARAYQGPRGFSAFGLDTDSRRRAAVAGPELSFDELPIFDYMNGPDGSIWYYTVEFFSEKIVHNEYWTEDVLAAYTFTVYDSQFNVVGSIHDKVEVLPGETRAKEILLDPTVTRRFYNDDDNYEIMVYHVMNTEKYVNHYYYKVYSIGGNVDADGNNEVVATMEGRCADAINLGDAGSEKFILTFISDPDPTEWSGPHGDGVYNTPEYVEWLNGQKYTLTSYMKGEEGLEPVVSRGIGVTRVPGDTTDGIYFISKRQGDDVYFFYSSYDKPYFVEPVLVVGDESATPDNSFLIETVRVTPAGAETVATTRIPVQYPDVSETLVYAFYSIGSVAWSEDIDMTVNGTPSAPAFIVAHDIEVVATEERFSNYEIYKADGTHLRDIALDTSSMQLFSDGRSQPVAMFIKYVEDPEGGEPRMVFQFVNLYDGSELFTLDRLNDGDPLMAYLNMVEEGGKKYFVFQMTNELIDDDGCYNVRVGWFNYDGTLERIDNVKCGRDVQVGQVNLDPVGLHPDFYDSDDAMEYCVLVKRTYGPTTRNEFLVVDHNGDLYAKFTADDGRGSPTLYTLLPGETNRIMMTYGMDNNALNVDLYELPFLAILESGVEEIADSAAGTLPTYDGTAVYAPGASIEVFDMGGTLMARGSGSVAVADLASGVYVVVATDAAGTRQAAKIRVR